MSNELQMAVGFVTDWIWPIVITWVGYIHTQLAGVLATSNELRVTHYKNLAEMNDKYATAEYVRDVEVRVVTMLNRIDDKVTKLLEHKNA